MNMTARYSIAIAAALLAAGANAQNLSDNFDSYANQAAFSTVWKAGAGAGLTLDTTNAVSQPNSVMNFGLTTVGAASYAPLSWVVTGNSLDFSFAFYDNGNGNARDYGMILSKAGTAWTGANNQILAIGKYNNATTTKYFARVAFGTPTLSDGATLSSGGGGWLVLGAGPDVSRGWHTAEIKASDDAANPGKYSYSFFIDGTKAGTAGNLAPQIYNWVMLGSGTSSSGGFLTFDNVSVTGVPEPSALALSLLGGFCLMIGVVCRRRD